MRDFTVMKASMRQFGQSNMPTLAIDGNDCYVPLSIIIPVYNVIQQLNRCLDSVAAQTSNNFEIILVDDGSTDGSGEFCDLFQRNISKRCTVFHQKNGGLSRARNSGIDLATGEYLLFLDSDDYIHPQTVEYLLGLVQMKSPDIIEFGFCYTQDSDSMKWRNPWSSSVSQWDRNELLCRLLGSNGSVPMTWSRLYHSKLFKDVRFPADRTHEDEFVTPIVCDNAASYLRTRAVLYAYVQREGSITNRPFSRSRLDALEAFHARFNYFHSKYGRKYDSMTASSWLFCCKEILREGAASLTSVDIEEIRNTAEQMVIGYRTGEKACLRFDKRVRTVLFSKYIQHVLKRDASDYD